MKKIILASESKQFTRVAMEFLGQLREEEPMFVVGGFTHSFNHTELINTSSEHYMGLVSELIEQDQEAVEENILSFKRFCQGQCIKCRVYREDYGFEIDKLVNESRFADLLVINNNLFGRRADCKSPKFHYKQALHKAECPILLLPQNCTAIKRIAVTYDGERECMFALKQFCYLFPQYSNIPVEIVYLSDEENDDIPQLKFLQEYVIRNFSSINICKININPKKDLANWVSEKKDVLVIAGSYCRAGLFSSLTDSFIDPILEMQQLPVFITHH